MNPYSDVRIGKKSNQAGLDETNRHSFKLFAFYDFFYTAIAKHSPARLTNALSVQHLADSAVSGITSRGMSHGKLPPNR
jgi:hypothetical protein